MHRGDATPVLTAAARGIGRATMEAFSRTGARVWATSVASSVKGVSNRFACGVTKAADQDSVTAGHTAG